MAPGFCGCEHLRPRLKRCFSLSKKVFTGRSLLLPFMLQQEVSFFIGRFSGDRPFPEGLFVYNQYLITA